MLRRPRAELERLRRTDRFACARTATLALALVSLASCGPCGRAPDGTRPGWRLPAAEVDAAVEDWSFTTAVEEIFLETGAPWGWHSVTIWCVAVDGRLFIATDSRREKRWVQELAGRSDVRIGIDGRVYPVRAREVRERELWNAVVGAYARKYPELESYDFPVRDDVSSGHIFELSSR